MQPTIGYEVLMTLEAIALSQACNLTLAQALAQLGFPGVLPSRFRKLVNTKPTERDAQVMRQILLSKQCAAIAEVWQEIQFVDGGAIAASRIEVT